MDFRELEKKYSSDAGFNKMVNLFTQLINEYQFMPSELREGLFLAQYKYEFELFNDMFEDMRVDGPQALSFELPRNSFGDDLPLYGFEKELK